MWLEKPVRSRVVELDMVSSHWLHSVQATLFKQGEERIQHAHAPSRFARELKGFRRAQAEEKRRNQRAHRGHGRLRSPALARRDYLGGLRVNSRRGIGFRQWSTQALRDHLVRGYTLNRQCFEHNALLPKLSSGELRLKDADRIIEVTT